MDNKNFVLRFRSKIIWLTASKSNRIIVLKLTRDQNDMTTIVYKDGILCADTQLSHLDDDGVILKTELINKISYDKNRSVYVAGAGSFFLIEKIKKIADRLTSTFKFFVFRNKYVHHKLRAEVFLFGKEKLIAIEVAPVTRLFTFGLFKIVRYEEHLFETVEYLVAGSGAKYAKEVIDQKVSAEYVVRFASKYDAMTNDIIDMVKIHE